MNTNNRLPVLYTPPAPRQAAQWDRIATIIAWGASLGVLAGLCAVFPGMVLSFFAGVWGLVLLVAPYVSFAVVLAVVIIQAFREARDTVTGVPARCAAVYPNNFASREEYEDFNRTSKYVVGEDVLEEAVKEYKEEIARREKSQAGTELEINK